MTEQCPECGNEMEPGRSTRNGTAWHCEWCNVTRVIKRRRLRDQ